jgi:hypothetical protein
MNRQRLVLIATSVILAVSAVYCWKYYPRQKTVAKLKYAPGSRAVAERLRQPAARSHAVEIDPNALRIDLLERKQPAFSGYKRDIFKPVFIDKETMLAKQAQEAAARARKAAQKAQIKIKPPPTPMGVQRELAGFKLLGFLQKDGKKTVFLGKGSETIVVRQGTTFAGRYSAVSLTDQVLIIKVTDTGEEVIMPLVDSQSANTARF